MCGLAVREESVAMKNLEIGSCPTKSIFFQGPMWIGYWCCMFFIWDWGLVTRFRIWLESLSLMYPTFEFWNLIVLIMVCWKLDTKRLRTRVLLELITNNSTNLFTFRSGRKSYVFFNFFYWSDVGHLHEVNIFRRHMTAKRKRMSFTQTAVPGVSLRTASPLYKKGKGKHKRKCQKH